MTNLLTETIEFLKEHGKTQEDVQWINCDEKSFSWDEFSILANFVYDNGFGGQIINESLNVIGKDWWIERHEYDGSEWWEFKTLPSRYSNHELIVQKDLLDEYWREGFRFYDEEDE